VGNGWDKIPKFAEEQLPKFNNLVFGSHEIGCVVRTNRLSLSPKAYTFF